MSTEDFRVAVCLPTYNEAENVEFVVNSLRESFSGYLFIVDGFSTDATVEIAKSLKVPVYSRKLPGKGSGIQRGLEVAKLYGKEFLIYVDCDRTYEPKDIKRMTEMLDNYDLVIGVRSLKSISPISRRVGNVIATELINVSLGSNIKDSISGLKALRVSKFLNLISETGFVYDALVCVEGINRGMNIQCVSISHYPRVGKSKMGFFVGVIELVKLVSAILNVIFVKRSSLNKR